MKNLASKKKQVAGRQHRFTPYEILDHPADLKIRAYGQNLNELFNNILAAMVEAMKPTVAESENLIEKIKIKSENLENLLVDFLSEVIYKTDLNNAVYSRAEFIKLNENELEGKIFGQKIKKLQTEIKAVTWHDFFIQRENKIISATIVFDI